MLQAVFGMLSLILQIPLPDTFQSLLNRSKSKLKMAIFFRKINKLVWYLSNFPHEAKGGPCYLLLVAEKFEILL